MENIEYQIEQDLDAFRFWAWISLRMVGTDFYWIFSIDNLSFNTMIKE